MRSTIVFLVAILTASAAHAQQAPPPTPAPGPLVLERIRADWVLAPDFKVTDVDGRTGELAGAYGGRLTDGTLLIGGAAYWLANGDRDFKLAYGGLLVGWQSPEFGRIRFGGRGLVGAGRATLGFDVGLRNAQGVGQLPRGDIRFGVTPQNRRGTVPAPSLTIDPNRTIRVVGRDDFFFVEPQASISARVTNSLGVSCGIGYRQTAQADVLRDRINGPTASLAVQFGW